MSAVVIVALREETSDGSLVSRLALSSPVAAPVALERAWGRSGDALASTARVGPSGARLGPGLGWHWAIRDGSPAAGPLSLFLAVGWNSGRT